MSRCWLLLILLAAFSPAFGKAEPGGSIEPPQSDVNVKWLFEIQNDSTDTPRGKVYLMVGEQKILIRPHAIGEYHALDPTDYKSSKVPATAITACKGWWAGQGEDLYVIRRNKQLIVYIRYLDESVRIGAYRRLKIIPLPK